MKIRLKQIGAHTYEVQSDQGGWHRLGIVRRFGSLPSMQSWRGLLDGDSDWMPRRQTRKLAIADLEARS